MTSNSNKNNVLHEKSPKVFTALSRFLDSAQLAQLAAQYAECAACGGNVEPGVEREVGVSFNPRLARILSLLVTDGGVREYDTLRAALYAASCDPRHDERRALPEELHALVTEVWSQAPALPSAALVRGVIELDSVRHLHQTQYPATQRHAMLACVEEDLLKDPSRALPEWLRTKLEHAISLQRRQIDLSDKDRNDAE